MILKAREVLADPPGELGAPIFKACLPTKMPWAHHQSSLLPQPGGQMCSDSGYPTLPRRLNKSTPKRPGHRQTAVAAADGKKQSLSTSRAADNSSESAGTRRGSFYHRHHSCSQGLPSSLSQGWVLNHSGSVPIPVRWTSQSSGPRCGITQVLLDRHVETYRPGGRAEK